MPKRLIGLLIVIFLIGWGLSIRQWNIDGLWYDEVWSDINAGAPPDGPLSPPEIAHHLATEDPDQGLAYPLILATWSAFVGWTPFAGRALSALAGLLCAALVARLGRRLYNPEAGAAAATVLLFSPFFIYYTHELRVFTIVAFSVAGLLWTYIDLMTDNGYSRARTIFSTAGFIISGLGLLYTHYFAATILIAAGLMHGVWFIVYLTGRSRAGQPQFLQRWLRISLLFIVVGLLFVPWLPVFAQSLQRTSTRNDVHAKALTSPALIEAVAYYLGSGFAILTVLLVILGVWAAWRRGARTRWLAVTALVAVAVVIGFNAVLQIIEPGRVRYLIVLWPPLALVMGMGIAYLSAISRIARSRWASVVPTLLIGFLALNGVRANFDPSYEARMEQSWTPPWQQMTRIIQQQGGPNDLFLFYAGTQHARHFYAFSFVTRGLPLASPALLTESLVDPTYGPGIQAQIDAAARLWYGIDKTQPERPVYSLMQTLLEEQFILCQTMIDTARFSFALYAREAAFCPQSPQIIYGDTLSLVGMSPLSAEVNLLPIGLLWQVGEGVTGITSLSLQLLDDTGMPVAQHDVGIPSGPYGIVRETLDLTNVPAGHYRLMLIVYRWQTGERLTGTWLATGERSDSLKLGEVDYHP
jgi:hypothetical protein